jgi:hypothetical protein
MEPIDFDLHFNEALTQWIEKNRHKFKHPEDMEDAAPDFYLEWLATPAAWLDGAAPGEYFNRFTDGQTLVDTLVEYTNSEVPVPDPLLDRLEELGQEEPILALVRDKAAPCEARMHGVELLRQLDSRAPMVDYIRWQVDRDSAPDLLDNALESLKLMGSDVYRPAKLAFHVADETGKEALLDVLTDYPCDDEVFAFALSQFKQVTDKRALYAGYLGKLGDDRAMEALLDAAEGEGIPYIDFIEVRNAIERLGGEAPLRDFSDDPTYAAVKRLQKR